MQLGDLTPGNWYRRFLLRIPDDHLPVVISIFYDGWKLSSTSSTGGLYFSIMNMKPNIYMRPESKFVLCLVPDNTSINLVLDATISCLQDPILHTNVDFPQDWYIEITQIIGDVPGQAHICSLKSHSANYPCRHCKIHKQQLYSTNKSYPDKSQLEIDQILQRELPNLLVRGQIKRTRDFLAEVSDLSTFFFIDFVLLIPFVLLLSSLFFTSLLLFSFSIYLMLSVYYIL